MLQPGICSATSSESRIWVGPPRAFATQSAMAIVGETAHGNSGPRAGREPQAIGVCLSDGVKRGLGRAVAPCKAKIPFVNVESAAGPFVGPAKYESPRATSCIRAAHQPVKR